MRTLRGFVVRLFILLITLVFLLPAAITVTSSFMSAAELAQMYGIKGQLSLIPSRVTGAGYFQLLFASETYLSMFWNSLFIACAITASQTVVSIIVAYVFARILFRGRSILLFFYISIMLMPFQATLLPNYLMSKQLGIFNTWWAVILPGTFSPFGAMVLYSFMRAFPGEVIEAALLDTSSRLRIITHIILPNIRAGVVVVVAITFSDSWNMVEQPLILLKDAWLYPLSLSLNSIRDVSPAIAFSGAVLYALPVIMIYALCKEELIDGIVNISPKEGA